MTATLELPDDIVDLSEYDESINLLLYGDSGVGKTVFAGGAGLILGVEKGTVSAKRQGSKAKLWPIRQWADIQKAYKWLRNNPEAFNWVAVDSLTEMQQMALRWILAKETKANPSRDIDIPQIQDHQKWQNMFKRFVKTFCDLETNVLFTALPLRVEDEEGMDLILPDLSGKGYQISQWVCAQMSVVGHMKKIQKKTGTKNGEDIYKTIRRVRFQYKEPYFAKDRYDVLGSFIDDPTLAVVDAKIRGEASDAKPVGKPSTRRAEASNRSSPAREDRPPTYSQTEGQDPAEEELDNTAEEDVDDIDLDEDGED